MIFIIEVIKLFFTKPEKKEQPNLTPEQKKKYAKQYKNLILIYFPIFIVLIIGLGETIIVFLQTGNFINIAISIVIGLGLEQISERVKNDIEILEQRIQKREKKNKKQGMIP